MTIYIGTSITDYRRTECAETIVLYSCIVSSQDTSDILPFFVSIFAELTTEAYIAVKQFTHSQTETVFKEKHGVLDALS